MRNGTRCLFFVQTDVSSSFFPPFLRPSLSSPLLLPFSADLFYRASSTFLCFGRQAEVVVTVRFVESVPEVSCSHDDSPEAADPPTRRFIRAKWSKRFCFSTPEENASRKDTRGGTKSRIKWDESKHLFFTLSTYIFLSEHFFSVLRSTSVLM